MSALFSFLTKIIELAELVDNIVKSAKGKTTWMCAESGTCVLSIEGFIVPEIGTQCETGECLIPSEIVLEDNNKGACYGRKSKK
jgi:hypothetical protein